MFHGQQQFVEAGQYLVTSLGVDCVVNRQSGGVLPTLTIPQIIQVAVGEFGTTYLDKNSFSFLCSDQIFTGDRVVVDSIEYVLDRVVFDNGVIIQFLGDKWSPP